MRLTLLVFLFATKVSVAPGFFRFLPSGLFSPFFLSCVVIVTLEKVLCNDGEARFRPNPTLCPSGDLTNNQITACAEYKQSEIRRLAALLPSSRGAPPTRSRRGVELVTNGDFETGDLTGWSSNDDFVDTDSNEGYPASAPGSLFSLFLGNVGTLSTTSQTLATTPGFVYALQFDAAIDGGTPSQTLVSLDGVLLVNFQNNAQVVPAGPALTPLVWQHFSFHVTATTASTVLLIRGQNNPSYNALDNFSVQLAAVIGSE
jgi:hypothetical protein